MIVTQTQLPYRYVTVAETAKLVRAALKPAFPGIKFSVRSSSYSGGASIDIKWTDGPTAKEVDAVTFPYKGANFDSMTDCKDYVHTVIDGVRVHYGADFIFAAREFSAAFLQQLADYVTPRYGWEGGEPSFVIKTYGDDLRAYVQAATGVRFGGYYADQYLNHIAHETNAAHMPTDEPTPAPEPEPVAPTLALDPVKVVEAQQDADAIRELLTVTEEPTPARLALPYNVGDEVTYRTTTDAFRTVRVTSKGKYEPIFYGVKVVTGETVWGYDADIVQVIPTEPTPARTVSDVLAATDQASELVSSADTIYFSRNEPACVWRFEKDGAIIATVECWRERPSAAYDLWSAINELLTEDDYPGDYDNEHADYGTPYRRVTLDGDAAIDALTVPEPEPTPAAPSLCAICAEPVGTWLGNVDGAPVCASCDDKIQAYADRVSARIERLQARADKLTSAANATIKRADEMASYIPLGQPLIANHYSYKRDRNYRDRIHKTFTRGFEALKKAEQVARRADAAENNSNRVISSDDPAAVLKLQAKIDAAEADQERMKELNKVVQQLIRSLKLPKLEAAPMRGTIEERNAAWEVYQAARQQQNTQCMTLAPELARRAGLTLAQAEKLLSPDFMGRIGFPSYSLTNNNANIRRMRERLEELKQTARAVADDTAVTEENVNGVTIQRDATENRLRLLFPGKPSADVIKALKSHGFRWSPSHKAWQRQLTANAEYDAAQVLKMLTA